jgi:hypothetical protein
MVQTPEKPDQGTIEAPRLTPTTTVTPPQPEESPTSVHVAGLYYELHNLSVEDGAKLYDLLPTTPTNYKQIADQYAQLAKIYESSVQIALPEGMDRQTAWGNYLKFVRSGESLTDKTAPYIKDFSTLVGTQMQTALKGTSVGDGIENTNNALRFTGGALGGVYDFAMTIPRLVSLGGTAAGEAAGAVTPGISDGQAKAFGAAYAAAMLHEGAMRENMPMFDSPFNDQKSMFWSYPIEASMAGLEYLSMNVPLVKEAYPYIIAAAKWVWEAVTHIGSTDKARSFSEILADTKTNIEKKHREGATWRSLTEERLRGNEVGAAEQKMIAAETVGGISTRDLAPLAGSGGVINGQDGYRYTVDPNAKGGVAVQQMQGPDGKPIDRIDRIGESAANVLGQTGQNIADGKADAADFGGVLGYGAAAAVGIPLGLKVAKPVIRGTSSILGATARGGAGFITGAVKGTLEAPADLAGAGSFNQVQKYTKQVDDLNAKKLKLDPEVKTAKAEWDVLEQKKAHTPGREGWGDMRERLKAKDHYGKLQKELTTVEEGLTGKKGLFGRTVVGAEEHLKDAKTALTARGGNATAQAITNVAESAEKRVGGWFSKMPFLSRFVGGDLAAEAPRMFALGKVAAKGVEFVAPVVSTGELAVGLANKDGRMITGSSVALTTMAAGAGIGAVFGGIGAIPGGLLGLGVGSIASIFTDMGATAVYDHINKPAPVANGTPVSDQRALQGLHQAASDTTVRTQGIAAPAAEIPVQAQQQALSAGMAAKNTGVGAAHKADESASLSSVVAGFSFGKMNMMKGDFNPFS